MPLQSHTKSDVLELLNLIRERVSCKDSGVMDALAANHGTIDPSIADPYQYLLNELDKAKEQVGREAHLEGEAFHSRNPLAALAQSHLNEHNQPVHTSVGDVVPAVFDVFGQGNPIVWAPVMVNILLEHLKAKADFKVATEARSYIKIPDGCRIALLGDWGADNNHAQRIAKLVQQHGAEVAIHLGDIYYAGNEYESQRFLANWPLTIGKNNSFALNGNHEMYSRGIPYFNTVLTAFGQEASYFTLYNDNWQIHGIDTAYVPFSINGDVQKDDKEGFWKGMMDRIGAKLPFVDHEHFDRKPDARLQSQWNWLQDKLIKSNGRRNIFLSHNQPVSAYLPEFEAGAFLYEEFWQLRQTVPGGMHSVLAWFFGHEHKGTIYKDATTEFKARLIGNGAIPHSRQALVLPEKDETNTACTAVHTMNDKALRPDLLDVHELDLAVSSFVIITLDGPEATAKYINEDGSLFLQERLSGGNNEDIELGEGYKILSS